MQYSCSGKIFMVFLPLKLLELTSLNSFLEHKTTEKSYPMTLMTSIPVIQAANYSPKDEVFSMKNITFCPKMY